MGRKNDELLSDVAADFFGDDVDWLDDESEEVARPPQPPASAPKPPESAPRPPDAATPPPEAAAAERPPVAPAASERPESPAASPPDWAVSGEPALDPSAPSNLPTLNFSAVPTLPARPAPEGLGDPPAALRTIEPPPEAPEPPAAPAPGPLTTRPSLAEPRKRRQVVPRRPATWKPKPPEPKFPDPDPLPDLSGPPPEPARVATPAPARRVAWAPRLDSKPVPAAPTAWGDPAAEPREPAPEAEAPAVPKAPAPPPPTGSETPAAAPEASVEEPAAEPAPSPDPSAPSPSGPFVAQPPRLGDAGWRDVVATLAAEAARTEDQPERAELYFAAGRLSHRRLGDPEAAELHFQEAAAAGLTGGRLFEERALLARQAHRWDELATHLEAQAEGSEGAARADVLMEAALLARHRLRDAHTATTWARQALEAEPQSYAALSVLRDLLLDQRGAADERAVLLGRLAEVSEGYLAAEAWVDQGRVLQELERLDDADRSFERALSACPWHAEASLALSELRAERGDHAGLAALYGEQARRVEADESHEAGGWWLAAARAHAAAGEGAEANDAYDKALNAGYLFAERERQGAMLRSGDLAGLAASILREVEALDATPDSSGVDARPFLLFRIGWLREHHLDDLDGALAAYRRGLSADPTAEPLADAVIRVLRRSQREGEIAAFLEERLQTLGESQARPWILLQLAERAEVEGDEAAAAARWSELLQQVEAETEVQRPVLRALAEQGAIRALGRAGEWAQVAELHAGWAKTAEQPEAQVMHLYRAATAGALQVPDRGLAVRRLQEILERVPDHIDSLRGLEQLSERPTRDPVLAAALRAAGEASSEPAQRAALLYRAARIFARAGLVDSAREAAERCIDQAPRFRPVLGVLFEAVAEEPGVRSALYRRYADHAVDAEARAWSQFAAACMCPPDEVGADLRAVLNMEPQHPGSLAMLEVQSLADNDWNQLAELYAQALSGEPTPEKARLSVRLAELYRTLERRDEAVGVLSDLAASPVEGRPLRAAARIAESLEAWEQAVELLKPLSSLEDRLERARLLAQKLRAAGAALDLLRELLDEHPGELGVCIQAARVAFLAEDREAMVRAQEQLATAAQSPSMKAAYSAWVAGMLEADGRVTEALPYWGFALEARPDSIDAFRGVVRGQIAQGDAEAIRTIYAQAGRTEGLAEALEAAGDLQGAAEVLGARGDDATLGELLIEERTRMALDDWQGAYDVLQRIRARVQDPAERAAVDGRRRWILAEKLADTDAAWELYQQLHAESPEDKGVIEALARIAGARGDTFQAIQYLQDLSDQAEGPADAARIQCRIAEVHELADDLPSARQAYLDALDHVSTDRQALDGLRRLAEAEEDWPGLIAVLQREAGLSDPARRLELLREIAAVTEARLGDPAVAMDAWRAVLDAAPDDPDAMERLLALSEASGEWGQFVETGQALAQQKSGEERSALLYRIGEACQDQLHRDDAVRYFEQAISGESPSLLAAALLEDLYRERADWAGVIRAILVQAEHPDASAERARCWARAAAVEVHDRHDRPAAAVFYAKVLELEPDHEDALRFMAIHLYEVGDYEGALPLAQRLEPRVEEDQDLDDLDTRMDLATFYFYLAELLRRFGEPQHAVSRYERALELNPTHIASLEAVAPLFIEAKRWRAAERVLRQLLQLCGGRDDKAQVAQIYSQLGRVERELGNREKAYKRFSKALEVHPNYVDALQGMALILEDKKEWNNLLNIYNDIIYHATVPRDVIDAYMTKGRILDEQMGRADKAAQHYQRSLEFDGEQPLAYLRLAELALRDADAAQAQDLAEKGLQLKPDDGLRALLTVCVAAAHHAEGHVQAAQEGLDHARALSPALAEALPAEPLGDLPALAEVLRAQLDQSSA